MTASKYLNGTKKYVEAPAEHIMINNRRTMVVVLRTIKRIKEKQRVYSSRMEDVAPIVNTFAR